eukprot:5432668-Amphidinium_carterae.1
MRKTSQNAVKHLENNSGKSKLRAFPFPATARHTQITNGVVSELVHDFQIGFTNLGFGTSLD